MTTIPASIPVLQWAAERARLDHETLEKHYPKWTMWLSGDAEPTLNQLESFAHRTHTSIGYFFLPNPPELPLPVPDFRTLRDDGVREPSPELLDTIFLCQERQDWYREYARMYGLPTVAFVGNARLNETPEAVANRMRVDLNLPIEERRQVASWSDALRLMITRSEEAGVLVMTSSVVGSNSHRKLEIAEFRGFALADPLAPLVFLNGSDSKAAQMFTLVHELAHIWLGQSGVTDSVAGQVPENVTERWCNEVAAEFLMPMTHVRQFHNPANPVSEEIQRLARMYKVSTLVALRRLHDAGFINTATLWQTYREEQDRLRELERNKPEGGDFYNTLGARTSKRFTRAILSSALEGYTSFTDASRMLGIRKTAAFYRAAKEFGVIQ